MTEPSSSTTKPLSLAAEQTWARLCAIRAQKRDLEATEKELCGQLRDELGRGEFAPSNGGPALTIYPTRRFDADLAARLLPADLLSEVQKTVVDTELLKKKIKEKGLPEQLYEMCQAPGNNDTVREAK